MAQLRVGSIGKPLTFSSVEPCSKTRGMLRSPGLAAQARLSSQAHSRTGHAIWASTPGTADCPDCSKNFKSLAPTELTQKSSHRLRRSISSFWTIGASRHLMQPPKGIFSKFWMTDTKRSQLWLSLNCRSKTGTLGSLIPLSLMPSWTASCTTLTDSNSKENHKEK